MQLSESIQRQLEDGKEYVVFGVADAKDIPENAISIGNPISPPATPSQTVNFLDDDSDDEDFTISQSVMHQSVEPVREPQQPVPLPVKPQRPSIVHINPDDSQESDLIPIGAEHLSAFSVQKEIDQFTFVEATPDRNPTVMINRQLAPEVENSDVENLPPMLGVSVVSDYIRTEK